MCYQDLHPVGAACQICDTESTTKQLVFWTFESSPSRPHNLRDACRSVQFRCRRVIHFLYRGTNLLVMAEASSNSPDSRHLSAILGRRSVRVQIGNRFLTTILQGVHETHEADHRIVFGIFA